MSKKFLEVFPELNIAEELKGLLALVDVERVTSSRDRSSLRVYIDSPRLIHKQAVYALEKGICDQLFPNKRLSVKIVEKYHLSGQYTPRKLLQVYKESILLELKHYSIVEYNMLRRAVCTFPREDVLHLEVEDSPVFRDKAGDLKRVLEKIFFERCNLPATVEYEYAVRKTEEIRELPPEPLRTPAGGQETEASPEIRKGMEAMSAGSGQDIPASAGSGQNIPSSAGNGQNIPASAGSGKNIPAAGGRNRKEPPRSAAPSAAQPAGNARGGKEGRRFGSYQKRSNNPDVLYGRDFDDDFTAISEITGQVGEVTVRGRIISADSRLLKSGKTLLIFDVTDFTDTISVKMFVSEEALEDVGKAVVKGNFIRLKGMTTIDRFDGELTIGSVVGIKKCEDFSVKREDHSPEKRVELHCHTKMSDMDGVSEVTDIIKRAKQWGMPAIAITDHGVVQAFTQAAHALDKNDTFKIIYGVEGYLVDDMKQLAENPAGQSFDDPFVVFDIETTGFSPINDRIIEIGAVKVEHGKITDRFSTFVNPDMPIPFRIEQLTGISDSMVLPAPKIDVVLPDFLKFCQGAALVAHNASFDVSFISRNARLLGMPFAPTVLDTVSLARMLLPQLNRFKLDTVAKALNISLENHHRAVDDAGCTAEIFVAFLDMLKQRGLANVDQLNGLNTMDADHIKKLPSYHIIILAKNDIGRVNLYRLVSKSHIDYFYRRPRIPRSLLSQYREGLIIGSACEAGELFQAVLRGVEDSQIGEIVNFYDYLEIQPLGNNGFMLEDEDSSVKSEEDLKNLNRRIVELGEQFHKPVCATCDVHFLDPEDEIYRRIIMASRTHENNDNQAPLYLRTTDEMLKEFEYLGSDKAKEVVITNTRMIADMCENISPVRPDKCPPVIENSDETLRKICYGRAHEIYGEQLPEIVVSRLERELNSIISNGFAVMYIIAQKLVWKSNEDGYLVGSRGSVGSSLVATMAGITEVNPLSPHYYCPNCHFTDFDSEEVKKFSGMSGCDMPDRECPVCGAMLKKEGHDIPFETFLGFKGDKEPDIDLNFSGEYQSHAHDYTEVIFGKGQTYRAGTIGTLADKTAYGYVKNYFEERGDRKRHCEINRLVQGCVGIRRTTGQHPGGIIVLPIGEDINSFTPVQRPANDMTSTTITTHFDYHSIDHNLLKLDILGHDDPTMIRMLQDLTGVDPREIPLDSPEVMSLFQNTSALGVTPEDIGGCRLGALGVPEFGTDFAMQMLIDAKPKYFSDLVRIAGLAHGTDVWLGNAKDLILSGQATIQTAICCRDDIMVYLIQKGLDQSLSFTIMESVRKGKGLKPDWETEMRAHDVPDWYIESCKKIKYMFPKAHAAAYVMMAWRIAYCKIFYPLAYYAAFFSIRASAFNYEIMCMGRTKLEHYLSDYRSRSDSLSKKEQDSLRDMRVVEEMYARGFEFLPLDIYKAQARDFQIMEGKLMPALVSIDGLGERAAESIVDAVQDGPFLSREDFRSRTGIGDKMCAMLGDLGLLNGLPENNQLSLFDFANGF